MDTPLVMSNSHKGDLLLPKEITTIWQIGQIMVATNIMLGNTCITNHNIHAGFVLTARLVLGSA